MDFKPRLKEDSLQQVAHVRVVFYYNSHA
jgi:hypothetical protein